MGEVSLESIPAIFKVVEPMSILMLRLSQSPPKFLFSMPEMEEDMQRRSSHRLLNWCSQRDHRGKLV